MTLSADRTDHADLTIAEFCTQLGIDPATLTRLLNPRRPARTRKKSDHLTIAEVCTELGIARSTFYDWRAANKAPKCIKLPNNEIRVRRADLNTWLESLEDNAA